jgi:uncharacterized protein (DUF983 family)
MLLRLGDYRLVILRGLRRRCPQCGEAKLFVGWHALRLRCPVCDLDFRAHDQNTWAFMYLSTAFLTGLMVVGMFLITPDNRWIGRAAVLTAAVAGIIGTLPLRKSVGVAIEYLVDLRSDHTPGLRLRGPCQ